MRQCGLTPHGLSVAIHKNPAYIRDLRRGLADPSRADVPKDDSLKAMARVMSCTVDYLRAETDDPSVDAADLVPETKAESVVLGRMKQLSEGDQERAQVIFANVFPRREDEGTE